MFRHMPFLLLIAILITIFLNPYISHDVKANLLALSLSIKSLILFVLPIIIFGLLFKGTMELAESATGIVGLILVSVCCSNFLSTYLSHFVGAWVYHFDMSIILPKEAQVTLSPAWTWSLSPWIPNDRAMFLGICLGLLSGLLKIKFAYLLADKMQSVIKYLLKLITLSIPLFVIGFVVKLQYDGVIHTIIRDYLKIFLVVGCAQFAYLLFAYFVLNRFQYQRALQAIKNMLPAAITGFCTMSSAVALPLTIAATEKNASNKNLARSVIPATVNIHLVGDCFAIPIFAYAVMKSYGMAEPAFFSYLVFVFYFVIAKFSVAAIPAGGIIVMLPILQSALGFNSEMLSLITALYILFDPVITSANVFGNGAFAMLVDKLSYYLPGKKRVLV